MASNEWLPLVGSAHAKLGKVGASIDGDPAEKSCNDDKIHLPPGTEPDAIFNGGAWPVNGR